MELRKTGDLDTRGVLLAVGIPLGAVMLGVAGALALPPRALANPVALPALAVAGTLGAALVLWRPRWVFLGYLLACMVVPMTLEQTSIPLGFMKLYVQDVVFAFNVGLIAVRSSVGKTRWRPIPFNRLVVLHFLLGVWGVFVGLKLTGHEFDNVFGDFRRAFFYFMNYFIALLLTDDLEDARRLRGVLVAGGVLLVGAGILQMASGQFYTLRFGDAGHILSHYELTFLSFSVFYALAQVLFGTGGNRWLWVVVAGAGGAVTLIGNFRAAWLSMAGGCALMYLFVPRRGKLAMVGLGAVMALLGGVALAVLWDVRVEGHSTLGEGLLEKTNVKGTGQDVNVTWRFESYRNAYGLWLTSPWIGRGLGEELEFSAPTSTGGAFIARGHRVHNSFLWMLMSVGVLGFALFAAIQARYAQTLARYVRRTPWPEGKATVLACLAFWVSFMISTAFEIFLESAMPISVFVATMALAMLTIYHDPTPGGEAGAGRGLRAP